MRDMSNSLLRRKLFGQPSCRDSGTEDEEEEEREEEGKDKLFTAGNVIPMK